MALKFDMGDASWARQMAYQQQQQTASTLGEDIGTAIGLGAQGIAAKAQKRWGADLVKAQDKGEDKYGNKIPKEGMDWREFKKLQKQGARDVKRKTRLHSKLEDSGIYEQGYQAYKNRAESNNITPKSQKEWQKYIPLSTLERYNAARKQ